MAKYGNSCMRRGAKLGLIIILSIDAWAVSTAQSSNERAFHKGLAPYRLLWHGHPRRRRCSSSVVEHPLGKGEVESSILSCSTSKINKIASPDQSLIAPAIQFSIALQVHQT